MHTRSLYILTLLFTAQTAIAQFTGELIPKKGLFIRDEGLLWAAGSEVNFFTPDKKHHHYYFTWWEQDIDSSFPEQTVLILGSPNTTIHGTYRMRQEGTNIHTRIQSNWNHTEPGLADIVHARLWLPFFREAEWLDLQGRPVTSLQEFRDTVLLVQTPFGQFRFAATHPFQIRIQATPAPGPEDYDRRAQYIEFIETDIPVDRNAGLDRGFHVTRMHSTGTINTTSATTGSEPVADAWIPSLPPTQVLPAPKDLQLKDRFYFIPEKRPVVASATTQRFRELVALKWKLEDRFFPVIDTRTDASLTEEAYLIEINDYSIGIRYRSPQGLQHALHTLVQLTRNIDGRLALPQGLVRDAPATGWRGIHMFTGPTSWSLHRRMYDRVLLPLKMNKVVLQCEQAQWKSRPEIHNSISVSLQDLQAEFGYLRKQYCEPIPLIQSLGHMEWFFKAKQNRPLAINPQYPYTLNPGLPAAQAAIARIWDEAFALLRPSVMHIGFDEIGMIGFHLPREKEPELWKTQIRFLDAYAKRKRATLMLWGDMGLAPGEGPDALNGVNKERAALIRSTIPRGSYVADWHYINDADPEIYKTSLRIWKKNGNRPLASPWLRPDNVRGFVKAAIDEQAGVLQTTWADFESSEANMLLNIEQFGAYVLALDYAWSGRSELPRDLPYDPVKEWVARFYAEPRPTDPRRGLRIPVTGPMYDRASRSGQEASAVSTVKWNKSALSGIRIKAQTSCILPEGTTVAILTLQDGETTLLEFPLRYGVELRSETDRRPIYAAVPGKDEKTLYRFFPNMIQADRITLHQLHPAGGLLVKDLVLIQ